MAVQTPMFVLVTGPRAAWSSGAEKGSEFGVQKGRPCRRAPRASTSIRTRVSRFLFAAWGFGCSDLGVPGFKVQGGRLTGSGGRVRDGCCSAKLLSFGF